VLALVSFWSALAPLTFLVVTKKDYPAPFWIVGVAWVTLVGQDATALIDGGTWLNTYTWPVLQFTLLALAVIESQLLVWAVAAVLVALAWAGMHGAMAGPEVWVPLAGSAAVLYNATDPLRVPMLWYCGAGTAFYVGFALTTAHQEVAFGFWVAYKLALLTAFALFGRAAWRAA
jgi:hypothetical protein